MDVEGRTQISAPEKSIPFRFAKPCDFLPRHQHNPAMSKLPQSFTVKKARILRDLSVPVEDYDDLSPKGSVDIGIRELIDEINALEGCVTTSSCAGRISVFLEGKKSTPTTETINGVSEDGEAAEEGRETVAKVGGKGGGGRWLFVSHDPVDLSSSMQWAEKLGMQRSQHGDGMDPLGGRKVEDVRFVHFKFEPMVSTPS